MPPLGAKGRGWPKGKKRGKRVVTPEWREKLRENARKPRLRRMGEKVRQAVREAMQLGVIDLLKGPILQRQIDIALMAAPADSTRAASWIADRFGLPVRSEQSVTMEQRGAPTIIYERVGFERPGSEAASAEPNGGPH